MRLLRLSLGLLLCLSATAIFAQQYTAKMIVFRNPGPYAESELLAMTAIKPGDSFTKQQLAAASQRLSDSGYFDQVDATVDGLIKAVEVRFTLKPIDQAKLLQPGYENFVWFADGELSASLNYTLPLLSHGIPEAGSRHADVQAAIEQLLAAKSIQATVTHVLVPPSTGHPKPVFEYQVATPYVILRRADLAGIPSALVPAFKLAQARAANTPYNEGLQGVSTADKLLAPLFDAGYLDARLSGVTRSAGPPSGAGVPVDLTATVEAGEPYHVSSLDFPTNALLTPAKFARNVRLHPKDLASRRELYATLAPVTQAYHDEGYMDAVVDARPTLDPAQHMVAYTITVDPGPQYRVKAVVAKGLSAAEKADFQNAFNLRPGDIYDESYVGTFLVHNQNIPSLQGYSGNFSAVADPDKLTIELTIQFHSNSITVR